MADEPLLALRGVSLAFGGLKVVSGLDLQVAQGEIVSVIGPNGAGKTTLFNLVTGVYQPTSGHIFLNGEEIGGTSPDQLARLGMSRTFQNLQICMNMSAIENVMVGAHLRLSHNLFAAMFR